jgi:hypothetical protein
MVLRSRRHRWHARAKHRVKSKEVMTLNEIWQRLRSTSNASSIFLAGTYMQRRNFIRTTLATTLAAAGLTFGLSAQAQNTINGGVLHSLSAPWRSAKRLSRTSRHDDRE